MEEVAAQQSWLMAKLVFTTTFFVEYSWVCLHIYIDLCQMGTRENLSFSTTKKGLSMMLHDVIIAYFSAQQDDDIMWVFQKV